VIANSTWLLANILTFEIYDYMEVLNQLKAMATINGIHDKFFGDNL